MHVVRSDAGSDVLFPTRALLPLSAPGGGQHPLPHIPRAGRRPLSAALGVIPAEAGKHDTTATRWTEGSKIVCKTLSSLVRSEGGRPRITYTTPIDLATVDPLSLAATAHLLQEWVPKRYDARVTMVRHRPFAVAIHAHNDAARIDWRASYDALTYAPLNPPEHIVTGMIRYLHAFGLEFGAFDFTVTPHGE